AIGAAPVTPAARSDSGGDVSIIGRDSEMARLFGALDESRRGPVVVIVSGESGIGKTSLCQGFLGRAKRERGATVLAGRCHEREAIPFRAAERPSTRSAGTSPRPDSAP